MASPTAVVNVEFALPLSVRLASVMFTVAAWATLNGYTLVPCTARAPEKIWTEVAENDEGEVVLPQAAQNTTNPNTHARVAVMGPFVSANGRSAGNIVAINPTAFGPE